MRLLNWLKSLLGYGDKKQKERRIKIQGVNDPNLESVINAAWHSGKPVYGKVDKKGKLTMTLLD